MQLTNGDISELTPEEQHLLADIRHRKAELLIEIEQLKDEISLIASEMARLESEDEGKINLKQKSVNFWRQVKIFKKKLEKGVQLNQLTLLLFKKW